MHIDVYIQILHENGSFMVEGFSTAEPQEFTTAEEARIEYDNLQALFGAGSARVEHICLFTRKVANLKDATFAMPQNGKLAQAEILVPGRLLDRCVILTQLIELD